MKNSKADYNYTIEGNLLKIVDLNLGNLSVTNDIEAVINDIRDIIGWSIQQLTIIYRDSDGNWDEVVPEWINGECINVEFKFMT